MKHFDYETLAPLAQHNWTYILTSIGIPADCLRNKHQPCPMCQGKDRFRYDDKQGNGTYFCNQCGSGDGFGFVMAWQQCTFPEALQTVARVLGLDTSEPSHAPTARLIRNIPKNEAPIVDKLPRLQAIWDNTLPIADSPVIDYLRGRGISGEIIGGQMLRYHPSLTYWTPAQDGNFIKLGDFPAMIGAITDPQGELQGLHITYLQRGANHWQKLDIYDPETSEPLPAKKIYNRMTGSIKGNAIRLDPINERGELMVCEGIETAFASRELFKSFNFPVWACLNANNLSALVLPKEVKRLLIVADNDIPRPIGFEASHALAVKAIKQGINVTIWEAEIAGYDALDELNRINAERGAEND